MSRRLTDIVRRSAVRIPHSKKGFTLVELLAVIGIAAILAVLSVPALQGLQKSGGFNSSVYAIADSLNMARAYAMANNTYVYVGFVSVDRRQNQLAVPQIVQAVTGIGGRVAVGIVATKDGTDDFTNGNWPTINATGGGLILVRQVQAFDSLFISGTGATFLSTTGSMQLPASNQTGGTTVIPLPMTSPPGPTSGVPSTPFSLPLGNAFNTGKYIFDSTSSVVFCFSPQGYVTLPDGTASQLYEIDFQPMVGTVNPSAPSAAAPNQAAIVIDGVTGAVNVYRP